MKTLDAPFLEIGFYFADLADADAYAKLARAILARGSHFIEAECWRGPGERSRPFESKRDKISEPLPLRADQLQGALEDPDLRVMEVSFDRIIGISKAPERLEYVSVFSEQAALLDRHPIVILAEGEPFSGPHEPDRGLKPGKKIYHAFRDLVIAVEPSYACIRVEAATECPTDLHQDPRGFADDFFVDSAFVGASGLATIARLFGGAYQERMGNGLYVSAYRYLNPDHIDLDRVKAGDLATEVGKLIGQRRPVRA